MALNLWIVKGVIVAASVAIVVIPARVHRSGAAAGEVRSRKGVLERVLLALASIGFLLPLVWVAVPVFAFADRPLHPAPFVCGVLALSLGLWLIYRSHADLGPNWSITLEVRESQRLVTAGVYGRVRHPMYVALLLFSLGEALVLPNWVAGSSYLVAVVLLVALRIGPEERMMRAEFGREYEEYSARTSRMLPGVW